MYVRKIIPAAVLSMDGLEKGKKRNKAVIKGIRRKSEGTLQR